MRTASTTRTGTRGLVAIAAISALGLAACSGGGGGPQTGGASKLTNDKIVIGLLNDQSGVYKDLSGPNSAVAIQMDIDDYKAKHGDQAVAKTVEIVREITGHGVAVLLVEQNVTFASTVADRHVLLAQGRVVERLDNDQFAQRKGELLDYLGL